MRRLWLYLDRVPIVLQVTAVVSLVLIAVLAGCLLAVSGVLKQSIRTTAGGHLESVAIDLAGRLDEGLRERHRDITTLAGSEPFATFDLSDPVVPQRWIEGLQTVYPFYAWIGLVHPDGTVLAATGNLLRTESVADRPWFAAAMVAPHLGDVHEAATLARLLRPDAREGSEPLHLIDIAAPVRTPDNTLQAVLGAHLSWDWAGQFRDAILTTRRQEMQTELRVVDRSGRVILGESFGTDRSTARSVRAALSGQAGWMIEDLGTGPMLIGHAPTRGFPEHPGLGWVVLASTPLSVADAPLTGLNRTMAATGAVLGLLGLLIAFFTARRLGRPLTVLTGVARAIGRDTPQTMPRLSGSREVVSLSLALRALVHRVGAVTQHLQSTQERALALEEQKRELEVLASLDPLTGLRNRRAFLELAEHEIARARRDGTVLSVLMIDIDHFKAVNDSFGHAAGDQVIRAIADRIRGLAREMDVVSRFGGEEFVVLLPDCCFADACAFGERLRASIADHRLDFEGTEISVTVSVGCAQFTPHATALEEAIDIADHALYIAKQSGRNRVQGSIAGARSGNGRASSRLSDLS